MNVTTVRPSSATRRVVRPVVPLATPACSLPPPTEDDFRLLEEHGSILALERAGLHCIADRLLKYQADRDAD